MNRVLKQTPAIQLADGRKIPVRLKPNARAKRLILRAEVASGMAVVTLPPMTPVWEAVRFAQSRAGWLAARLPPPAERRYALVDGGVVPYQGVDHMIRHRADARGAAWIEAGVDEIHVAGKLEHLPRRVTDFLKRRARTALETAVRRHTSALNVSVGRLTVRDTKSRWGSCTSRGDLNFSWRLIMTPPDVLDYVAAHEVAHRLEHNHSSHFWALVERLVPDMERRKQWLRRHGRELMAIV